jgi:hypothetical protein
MQIKLFTIKLLMKKLWEVKGRIEPRQDHAPCALVRITSVGWLVLGVILAIRVSVAQMGVMVVGIALQIMSKLCAGVPTEQQQQQIDPWSD